ncbi:sensor domain-containing protein [Actinospica durhamensis]|uniref:histidine kinase n=1 Tax=Actinospica durhamensis TaxID=1508375 RepID=A0A941ENS7_9ACTN|nr:sensor domain-containing protein [Actinospica durhamensis]MBR7834338.1 sensor domain-containing protein [Actinospica durhamensis]
MDVARRVLWEPFTARSGRAFVYCLCQPFLTVGALIVISAAIAVSALGAGVPALVLAPPTLAFCRSVGSAYRGLARNLIDVDIPTPVRARRRPGALGFVLYHYAEQIGWRALAHVFVKVLFFGFEIVVGVGFRLLLPVALLGVAVSGAHLNMTAVLVVGAVLFLAAPSLTDLVLLLDVALARRLLGPTEDSLRIRELEQTRTHAINEASATLRRIERDLHDGAQARLVALGIRLGRAESQFERGRAEAGLALLRESRAETKEIIQELRDLVRGIHPPALDGGLEPALVTLASLTQIPTTVRVALPARLPSAAETMLYFAAAELLANAGKHSGANAVAVSVLGDGLGSARLIVTDDGRGGADARSHGSGLRGLAERVRGLDGQVSVNSPAGGPTTVVVELPARDVHDARPEPAEGH